MIRSWILRAVLLLWPVAALAQSVTATLQGTVADDQGAVLPRANITITNVETGLTRASLTDDRGRYRAAALPPGPYQLRAELSGFRTETRSEFLLTIGQEATVDLTMKLASIEQSIVVTAPMARVDTTHHTIGSTVTRTQLDALPLASRDFASLALLSPGIFSSPDLARPGSSAFGDSFTSGGQTSRNNSFLIDGLSNDEILQGTTRGGFSLETVREFVVLANQFSAEHGLASGAIVSVVTQSGTNSLQSRAFLFDRDDRLDAQDPFSAAQGSGRAPFNLQRFGGFVGRTAHTRSPALFRILRGIASIADVRRHVAARPCRRARDPQRLETAPLFRPERLPIQRPHLIVDSLSPERRQGAGAASAA